jgi:putative DNA primase/helicase
VFCASVNEETFLVDPTGNSRFWTLPVVEINYRHDINMQQVFAQLAVDLDQGAQWWLTPEEDAELEVQNDVHRAVSSLEESLGSSALNVQPTINAGNAAECCGTASGHRRRSRAS